MQLKHKDLACRALGGYKRACVGVPPTSGCQGMASWVNILYAGLYGLLLES